MATQPYELWETNRFLGVFSDVRLEPQVWLDLFPNEIRSTDEYIDFEKLPLRNRKMAPFVMPLARGKAIYDDSTTHFRFKPAYVKTEDRVDPLMPLTRRAGIDSTMTQADILDPMQRLDLIRMAMTASHVQAIDRTWEWMSSRAIIDGKITLTGTDYPTTLVDFRRDAGHTITLTAGSRFGDAGVSIVDFIQSVVDMMANATFGGVPVKIQMGGGVWQKIRKDPEFLAHLDKNTAGGTIEIVRGLVSPDKIFQVGTMLIGGQSGQKIELWVNNETYIDQVTGAVTRYVANNQMVFTGTPDAINGYRAFGRIIDKDAGYEAIPIFPKNWEQKGDVTVEYITHKSAPLFVPINPNATACAFVY